MPLTIYLADDHIIVAQGVANLLKTLPNVEQVIVFNSGKKLIEALDTQIPDLIILDIEMPEMNGIEALKALNSITEVPCVMLSMNDEKYIIQECMKLGAKGFLPKDCNLDEMAEAIEVIMDGGTYLGERINKILTARKTDANQVFELPMPLTKREQEILADICDGRTCKEIANKLYLSTRTVETHKKSIMTKFDVHTTGKLVSKAIKYKFVKP